MIKRFLICIVAILCCVGAIVSFASCDGENQAGSKENNGDSMRDIFYVKFGETKIELGKNADAVLSALGEAKSVKELGDCAGLGAQVKYSYDNFDIYTIKSDKDETIDEISFTSDIAVTPKGICLGADVAEVTKAYGTPTSQSEKEIRYTQGQNSIKFGLKNGAVASIEYIRTLN